MLGDFTGDFIGSGLRICGLQSDGLGTSFEMTYQAPLGRSAGIQKEVGTWLGPTQWLLQET